MIDIAQHIEYLLARHDCVVVPGFGAFMVNREPARYDSALQIFFPPTSSIGFNPEVRHNDALLSGSISRREGMSIDAARIAVDNAMASLLHQLRLHGEVSFGRLGVFHPGVAADAPVFEPSAASLPVRRFVGLQPLSVRPFGFVDEEEVRVEKPSDRQVTVIPLPLKIVASIVAIMVGLGILYSTTSLVNGPKVNFASLDTGISTHIERVIDSTVDVSREILLNIAMPPAEATSGVEQTPEPVAVAPDPVGRYILVVGSFPTQKAAERHIAQVADPSLRIMEMDGNFRVYAASAGRIDDARKLAVELAGRYPSVWICRR